MSYIEEALNGNLISDQLFHEGILEQIYIERDFMMSCLENNIILEADAPESKDKTNWITKIKDTIKSIFNKFIENVQNLFKADEKWISDNIPKLKNLNFDGLKVNILPYWNLDSKNITNVLSELQKEVNNMKYGDARLKNLQDREDVEQRGAFKKYVRKNGTFADGIKSHFKVGETNEPKPVTLEGNQLKIVCVNQMSRYVNEYNSTLLPSLRNSYNNFNKMLDNVEREISRNKPVGEAFCIIEDSYYVDTELKYCKNYSMLFEADEQNQNNNTNSNNTNNNSNDNKPALNKVEDTSNNNNSNENNNTTANKSQNLQYYTYLKHVIQLNQLAIAASLTACEERYKAYMSVLRGVVASRGGKK